MMNLTTAARAVLWDLDGTLVDSEPAHQLSFINAIRELKLVMPDQFLTRVLGLSERQIHVMLQSEAGLTLNLAEWRAVKWRHFRAEADRIETRSGTVSAFRKLEKRGLPMAVVSNSTRDELNFNLRSAGLEAGMSARISVQDVAEPKPAPEGFLSAAAQLGIAAHDCIVVEDTLPGSRAGLAAGMKVIFQPQHPVPAADIPGEVVALAPDAPLWPVLAGMLGLNAADASALSEKEQ